MTPITHDRRHFELQKVLDTIELDLFIIGVLRVADQMENIDVLTSLWSHFFALHRHPFPL